MPTQRLQQLLQQLNAEIRELDESNMEEKQRLEALIAEIETALAQDEAEHAGLLDGLRAKLVEIDSEHPTASGVMRRLMQALGDMGI